MAGARDERSTRQAQRLQSSQDPESLPPDVFEVVFTQTRDLALSRSDVPHFRHSISSFLNPGSVPSAEYPSK